MIRLKQAVVVEGRYDKIKLSSIVDTLIIETDGFGIFKDKEKLNFIRRLAKSRGIIVMTDSDSAGFLIRSHIRSTVTEGEVIDVYIPDIKGREKRKVTDSAEGLLGVEGVSKETILAALKAAGVQAEQADGEIPDLETSCADVEADISDSKTFFTDDEAGSDDRGNVANDRLRRVTKADLYDDGLYGGQNSRQLREALLGHLGLPKRISANAIEKAFEHLVTYDEYRSAVEKIKGKKASKE